MGIGELHLLPQATEESPSPPFRQKWADSRKDRKPNKPLPSVEGKKGGGRRKPLGAPLQITKQISCRPKLFSAVLATTAPAACHCKKISLRRLGLSLQTTMMRRRGGGWQKLFRYLKEAAAIESTFVVGTTRKGAKTEGNKNKALPIARMQFCAPSSSSRKRKTNFQGFFWGGCK